ncbi:MAG: hypothetical protein H6627_12780 [Calditrichae bacterium]|nr:hypothetical protein [Calditrichota bacterium]MCB9059438.1 hypothetical protein [Calditrichia bacterium]
MKNKLRIDLIFIAGFCLSLFLHLLIVTMTFHPGNVLSMPFTAGMLIAWLYASRTIKDIYNDSENNLSFKSILFKLPQTQRYILLFLTFYAIINFITTLSAESGNGWVDLNLSHDKLRGISGFWILFYAIGYAAAHIEKQIGKSPG